MSRARWVRIDGATITQEIAHSRSGAYPFRATAEFNDMWLEIDFGDLKFERLVAGFIRGLLAAQYRPFRDAPIIEHC